MSRKKKNTLWVLYFLICVGAGLLLGKMLSNDVIDFHNRLHDEVQVSGEN